MSDAARSRTDPRGRTAMRRWRATRWSPRPRTVSSRSAAPRTHARRSSKAAASSSRRTRVMSNAHVVAGADSFTVSVDGKTTTRPWWPSTPCRYLGSGCARTAGAAVGVRPRRPHRRAPMPWSWDIPAGGRSLPTRRRIREVIELNGPDIYRTTTVTREVYTIRGKVGQGDSGGPLIDRSGRVLGMNFGAAVRRSGDRLRAHRGPGLPARNRFGRKRSRWPPARA